MRCCWHWRVWALLVVLVGAQPAQAQTGMAGSRSLGGYGAATIGSYYRSGGGRGVMIPYGGGQNGFIPYGRLEAPDARAAALTPRRIEETPIGGSSLMLTPRGMPGGSRGAMPPGFGLGGGAGMSGGLPRMSGREMGRPRSFGFGYPFRMPPAPGGGGSGPAMGAM